MMKLTITERTVESILLLADEDGEGPGFSCTSPDSKLRLANHVTDTMTNRYLYKRVLNFTLSLNLLLKGCFRRRYFMMIFFQQSIVPE